MGAIKIEIPNMFFYNTALEWLNDRGVNFEVTQANNGVILTYLEGMEEGKAAEMLQEIRCQTLIPPFVATNRMQPIAMWKRPGIGKEEALNWIASHADIWLYENCAGIEERGEGEKIPSMARGKLPFLAYHVALDGLYITHISQVFLPDYDLAQNTAAILARTLGVEAVYVCIDDRGGS